MSLNITYFRGDTEPFIFTLTTSDGAAYDLTGATATMTASMAESPTDTSTQIFQLSGTITAPATGVVSFSPLASDTDYVGVAYYDIQITKPTGAKRTVIKDRIVFIQDHTK